MRDGQRDPRRQRIQRGPARPAGPDVSTPSVNRLPVVLEKLDGGRTRMTSPDLPGFSAVARGVHELGRIVDQAWNELQIVAYAATRGVAYDAAHHQPKAEHSAPGRYGPDDPLPDWRLHRNGYPPADWVPLPGGDWESPGGRRYGAGAWQVAQVKVKRAAMGLPIVHPDDAGQS